MTENVESLTDVVDRLANADLNGDGQVEVEEIFTVFGERSFGPLFVVLALLQLLPTGLIPLVTGLVGNLTLLLSWQLLIGTKHPWIPQKLLRIKIEADKVTNAVTKARPHVVRVSKLFRPRANFLIETQVAARFIGAYGIALAAMILVLGFIPGGADPVAIALLLLGIGLVAMDGWAVIASYAVTTLILTVFFIFADKLFG